MIKIEILLPDAYVECDSCNGKRYNRETLEVKFKDKSIADVLDMTVDEASEFFKAVPMVRDKMIPLQRVGLGYIKVSKRPLCRVVKHSAAGQRTVETRDRSHTLYSR